MKENALLKGSPDKGIFPVEYLVLYVVMVNMCLAQSNVDELYKLTDERLDKASCGR